ncbi:hypothetical protein CUMW_070990 [Citrus unshiu]|nr:hypothetical protein CUMW_070990 [Citrus unshiu]
MKFLSCSYLQLLGFVVLIHLPWKGLAGFVWASDVNFFLLFVHHKWMTVGIVKMEDTKQISIKQLRDRYVEEILHKQCGLTYHILKCKRFAYEILCLLTILSLMLPQWLMHHQPSMKQIMTIMAERDAALQERNLAISEKKAAIAERDMAFLQRDTAIAERNNAILERDNAIASLQYRENSLGGNMSSCPPGCQISRGVKHMHHPQQHVHQLHHVSEAAYSREMHTGDALPVSPGASEAAKPRRYKRAKEPKVLSPNKKTAKSPRKVKRENEDLNKVVFGKPSEWKSVQDLDGGDDDVNKQSTASKSDWKGQVLGLNQVTFDESTMPPPACSCTGVLRQCYKWGNGGWQSACCTTSLSMYPLPAVPNKRHARVGGRKMSGSAFNKLLTRLAAEGHDLSHPVDLKDHWAKHGTNRYITIK